MGRNRTLSLQKHWRFSERTATLGTTNTQWGLTTPSETHGVVSLPRIHRTMPEGDRNVTNAVASLDVASPAPSVQPCLNPTCPHLRPERHPSGEATSAEEGYCAWPKKGRPGYFCSSTCREQYEYERVQLAEDIKALDEAIRAPGGTYRDRRRVETELAKRRWAMQRYLFDSTQLTPTRTPSAEGSK